MQVTSQRLHPSFLYSLRVWNHRLAADCWQPVWLSTYFGLTLHYTLSILLYMHSVQSCVEIVWETLTHIFTPQGLIIRYISSWHAAAYQPLQRQHQPAISTQVDIRLLNLPPLRNHKTPETLIWLNTRYIHLSHRHKSVYSLWGVTVCVFYFSKSQHTPGEDIAGTVATWYYNFVGGWGRDCLAFMWRGRPCCRNVLHKHTLAPDI